MAHSEAAVAPAWGDAELAFGPFNLSSQNRRLWRDGQEVVLMPKAMDVLIYLVENAGKIVRRDELLDALWPGTYVDDHALSVQIRDIRRALGDDVRKPRYVETRHRRGYAFVAEVSRIEGPDAFRSLEPEIVIPATRYARSDDLNIAYHVIGNGPIDLVFIMGWISHLEYFWQEPRFARFLQTLSSFSRLIVFDKRGTGLSDRVPLDKLPTLEQRMDDLRAVMDAADCRQAAILGVSEGGPLAAVFAATYPERTSALVMVGTYARRLRAADYPWGRTTEQRERFLEEIREQWGGPVGIEDRAPSLVHDARFREWWATYLRMGASPGAAQALTRMNAEVDVRDVLPVVRVPTLVIHRQGDRLFNVEEGRYVASRIPGARFVELPGEDHLPFVGNQDELLTEVKSFLTNLQSGSEPDRVLATVLVAEFAPPHPGAGDWERMQGEIRADIKWHRGTEAGRNANTWVISFEGPTRAVQCVRSLAERAVIQKIVFRAALHIGECEVAANRAVSGPAVTFASRLKDVAKPGEILASNTIKDLAAGSGVLFEDRCAFQLEGLEGDGRILRIVR